MKAGGGYSIDNVAENIISGLEYAASSLSYLFEDITSGDGSVAAVLPTIEERLSDIYKCDFDVTHITTAVGSFAEFFSTYFSRRAQSTQKVGGFNTRGRGYGGGFDFDESFNQKRVRLLEIARGGSRDEPASPFVLEFSQNGGFTFEQATPDDFILRVVLKQKNEASYGQFLLDNLSNSGPKIFDDMDTVDEMKRRMASNANEFNKAMNTALLDSFMDQFTDLYTEVASASGNMSARILNINVDWKQDRTTVSCDIGIYIQDFRL